MHCTGSFLCHRTMTPNKVDVHQREYPFRRKSECWRSTKRGQGRCCCSHLKIDRSRSVLCFQVFAGCTHTFRQTNNFNSRNLSGRETSLGNYISNLSSFPWFLMKLKFLGFLFRIEKKNSKMIIRNVTLNMSYECRSGVFHVSVTQSQQLSLWIFF